MSEYKKGDYVRVTLEGYVGDNYGNEGFYLRERLSKTANSMSIYPKTYPQVKSVEKIDAPVVWSENDVVLAREDGYVLQRNARGQWLKPGRTYVYSNDDDISRWVKNGEVTVLRQEVTS